MQDVNPLEPAQLPEGVEWLPPEVRKRNLQGARSFVNREGSRCGVAYCLEGHVIDDEGGIESSVFRIVEPYKKDRFKISGAG